MEKINIADKFALFSETWAPKIIAQVDGYQIKAVKIFGEFIWHKHDFEDELFMVIDGTMDMRFRDHTVKLIKGEMITVPKGVEHAPYAETECQVLVFERESVINTGDADASDRRQENLERI